MVTYRDYVEEATRLLLENNIDNARGEAFMLLEAVSYMTRQQYLLCNNDVMPEKNAKELLELVFQRAKHVPLQHILGFSYFYGRRFDVSPDVLIPRFDTECVVEYALEKCKEGYTVLDMCTGSGCIAITMALEKSLKVMAVDISPQALSVAMNNAVKLKADVKFCKSDLFDNLDENNMFDMIVSNPPYIPTDEINELAVEVKEYDPLLALDGSSDGLSFYRRIVNEGSRFLKKGGRFVFEIGSNQADSVKAILEAARFEDIISKKDLAGLDRIVSAVKR